MGGDHLGCHFTSILQSTGLQYRDFIHISFHNQVTSRGHTSRAASFSAHGCVSLSVQIYEIPFFVALDHKREAVLVAVRGTLSLKVSVCDGHVISLNK